MAVIDTANPSRHDLAEAMRQLLDAPRGRAKMAAHQTLHTVCRALKREHEVTGDNLYVWAPRWLGAVSSGHADYPSTSQVIARFRDAYPPVRV
jgi:hypothetical protein